MSVRKCHTVKKLKLISIIHFINFLQVFRVTNRLNFNNNLWDWFNTAEVIKIVRMVQKQGQERKPMELLAHEVDMFELVKKHKSENVIKVHAA